MTKIPMTIHEQIERLFAEPKITIDLATQYETNLLENLTTTEKAIHKDFYRIILLFMAFLILDSGLVDSVSIVGTQMKRSGYLLTIFPLAISFFYYQLQLRIHFAHEIRTCLALLFRNLNINLYLGMFDILLHYPSIRNIESYQGKYASGKTNRAILELSTTMVTLAFALVPIVFVLYSSFRLRAYSDLPIIFWLTINFICAVFLVRALMIAYSPAGYILFSERKTSTRT